MLIKIESSRMIHHFLCFLFFCGLKLCFADKLECTFKNDYYWDEEASFYTCNVKTLDNKKTEMMINDASKNHLQNKSDYDVKQLVISNTNTDYLPNGIGILFSLTSLMVYSTSLKEIHPKNFAGMNDLEFLYLAQNQLTFLPKDSFLNLKKLKKINLSQNQLEVLQCNLFSNNFRLDYIWLQSNKISYIESDLFQNLNKLNYVDLRNNKCVNRIYSDIVEIYELKNDKESCKNTNGKQKICEQTINQKNIDLKIEMESIKTKYENEKGIRLLIEDHFNIEILKLKEYQELEAVKLAEAKTLLENTQKVTNEEKKSLQSTIKMLESQNYVQKKNEIKLNSEILNLKLFQKWDADELAEAETQLNHTLLKYDNYIKERNLHEFMLNSSLTNVTEELIIVKQKLIVGKIQLNETLIKYETEKLEVNNDITKLKLDVNELKKDKSQLQNTISNCNKEKVELNKNISKLNLVVSSMEINYKVQANKLAETKSQLEDAQKLSTEKRIELQSTIEMLESQKSNLNSEISKLKEVQKLEAGELAEAKNQLQKAQNHSTEEKIKLQSAIEKLESEKFNLHSERTKLKEHQKLELAQKKTQLEDAQNFSTEEKKGLQTTIKSLENQNSEQKTNEIMLNTEIKKLKEDQKLEAVELAQTKTQLEDAQKLSIEEKEGLQSTINILINEKLSLLHQIEGCKTEFENYKLKKKPCLDISTLQSMNTQLERRNLGLQNQINDLNAQIHSDNNKYLYCEYSYGWPYTCIGKGLQIYNNKSEIYDVIGEHLIWKENPDVIQLKMVNSEMFYVPNNVFEKFNNLQTVYFQKISMKFLTKGNFNGASEVKSLFINNNPIKSLDENIFDGANNLESIDMNSNEIEKISAKTFENLLQLKQLSLMNNSIEELDVNVFKDLINLNFLNLSLNKLKYLDGKLLQFNKKLVKIYFSRNELEEIGEDLLSYSKRLENLDFTGNKCFNINAWSRYDTYKINQEIKTKCQRTLAELSFSTQ